MPGMIPRGAREPGARREGEAHGASARAGARRARQGGRGGRARVRGRDAQGARGGPRGVPGHVPARAHGAQRGRGPRPCAAREGAAVSCQVDGTRPGESPAGRRPGSAAALPRGPRRSAAPRASAACRTPRCARPAGGRARHGGRYAREARGLPGAPRGVPPGRPGHHPGWFLWDERTRGPGADRADTLSGQAATGSYDNTRFALAREPQPFWSYWEDKLAVSTVV